MTGPGASGASRLRIAGVALLGVAAIAAVVGLISLGGQGTSSAPAAPPTASGPPPGVGAAQTAPGQQAPGQPAPPAPPAGALPGSGAVAGAPAPGAAPPVTGALPPVAAAPPIVPGGGAGGAGGSGGGAGGGGGGSGSGGSGGFSATAGVPVRVYNNSMIVGLAEKAGDQMRARGLDVVETGNYAQGVVPVSTAYYRPGTNEQGAADAVASMFGLRSEPRFPGIANASPGVIVIATNNWGQTAQKGS